MNTTPKVIKVKGGLLALAKQLGTVSEACTVMGDSRDSFYRFKELDDAGGEAALSALRRRKPHFKNGVAPEVEEAVVAIALEQPAGGQRRAATALAQRGRPISAAGVRCVGERNGLETLNKRRRAVAATVAGESHIFTAAQLAALEKAQVDKEAQGEFESE